MTNLVDDYGWNSPDIPRSCDYVAPCILKILADLGVKRVVDIGSGNGILCSQMYQAGFDVVGIENDKKGVEIAKQSFPSIPFYNYGVQDDPSLLLNTEKKFEAVVSTEVIEHLFSPHLLPQYSTRLLGKNGYLILSTPYHGYLKNLALSLVNKWDTHFSALWHGGHIKFFSCRTLTELLEYNGFKVIDFFGVGRIPFLRIPYLWNSMILVAIKTE